MPYIKGILILIVLLVQIAPNTAQCTLVGPQQYTSAAAKYEVDLMNGDDHSFVFAMCRYCEKNFEKHALNVMCGLAKSSNVDVACLAPHVKLGKHSQLSLLNILISYF